MDEAKPKSVRRSRTQSPANAPHFDELTMFKPRVATGAVVTLYPQKAHLREDVLNLPSTSL